MSGRYWQSRKMLAIFHVFAISTLFSGRAFAEAIGSGASITLEGLGILTAVVVSAGGAAATWGYTRAKVREHDEAITGFRRTLYGPSGEPEQGLVVRLVRALDRLDRAETDAEKRATP